MCEIHLQRDFCLNGQNRHVRVWTAGQILHRIDSKRFEAIENAFKITLPNVNYEAETTVQKNPLSGREQQMLEFISAKQPVSRAEIEAAMGLSQSVTVRTIKKLLELGLIQKSGGGKNTVYFQEKESDDDEEHKN